MQNYKYFEPEQWVYQDAWLEIDEADQCYEVQGRYYIQVGTYKEHKIYINGEWEYSKEDNIFYILPFDCDLVFDTEKVPGGYEEAEKIISELCDENFALYWRKYDEYGKYIKNNSNAFFKTLMECFQNKYNDEYKKVLDFVGDTYTIIVIVSR